MTDADVILPVTTASEFNYIMATMAIRTCRASTDARIIVMLNNSEDGSLWNRVVKQCSLLGIECCYVPGPFNIAKIFNNGASLGVGKYIAYGTSDVIYYPGWLENLISLWEKEPDYFALCTYSFDDLNMPCVSHEIVNEPRIVQTHNPSSGVIVIKRESNYVWDEQFPLWEIDADFLYYLEHNKLKAGYCLNARADHLIGCVRNHIDLKKHFGMKNDGDFFGGPRIRLEKKWGLERPKELQ